MSPSTPIPQEAFARAAALSVTHKGVLWEIVGLAAGSAQVFTSSAALAERCGVGRQVIRTAVAALRDAGLISVEVLTRGDEPLGALITLLFVGESMSTGNQGQVTQLALGGIPEPKQKKKTRAEPTGPDVDVLHDFQAVWREQRGGDYQIVWGRDRKAAMGLLRMGDRAEIRRRAAVALREPFFQRAGHPAMLLSRWSNYDGRATPAGALPTPVGIPKLREIVGVRDGAPVYRE